MKKMKQDEMTARRQFLGTVAAGAAAFGLASFPLKLNAEPINRISTKGEQCGSCS